MVASGYFEAYEGLDFDSYKANAAYKFLHLIYQCRNAREAMKSIPCFLHCGQNGDAS